MTRIQLRKAAEEVEHCAGVELCADADLQAGAKQTQLQFAAIQFYWFAP